MYFKSFLHFCNAQDQAHIKLDLIMLHGEFSLFTVTVRGNLWHQIYQNQRQKILCLLMALIT